MNVIAILAFVGFCLAMWIAHDQRFDRRHSHLRWKQWHHAYAGAMLFIIGVLTGTWWVKLLGVALLCDDAFQHLVQATTGDLWFRSPLHWVYSQFWVRWEWVRQVNWWLDGLVE